MSEQAEVDTVDDDHHDDDDVIVLSWWHNPVNLIVMGIGLILVIGALGWVLGNNHAQPDPNDVDVGFLQDMHWHHDQAVQMALIYLSRHGHGPGAAPGRRGDPRRAEPGDRPDDPDAARLRQGRHERDRHRDGLDG